jgi:hypothetical protein
VARAIEVLQLSGTVDDGDTGELEPIRVPAQRIADPNLESFAHRLVSGPHGIEQDLLESATRQSEGAIAVALRIAEAAVGHPEGSAVALGLASGSLRNRDQLCSARLDRLALTLHLDEMLATDRSAEVAQEEEHGRPLAPQVGEADGSAAGILHRNVRGLCGTLNRPVHPIPRMVVVVRIASAPGKSPACLASVSIRASWHSALSDVYWFRVARAASWRDSIGPRRLSHRRDQFLRS